MTKFKLDQEVFYIEVSEKPIRKKCLDCGGEGRVPSKVEGKSILCSSCRGAKTINAGLKTKCVPVPVTIVEVNIFRYLDDVVEEYIVHKNSNIYSSNFNATLARLEVLSDCFDAGYNNISVKEEMIRSIDELYGSKEDAIKVCKILKEERC